LAKGTVVAGRYRIERTIGEGGMGTVYEAMHLKLQKPIALKMLSDTAPRELAERFEREAIAASRVRHPGIVVIHDSDTHDGVPWIAMELLEGESLRARMAREPKVQLEQALDWMEQALDALAAVHEAGIVHRDLKPDNLFLEKLPNGRERVKLLDFGIAKIAIEQLHRATATHTAMGTPFYLAPEQASSAKDAGPAADVYGLGVVLFELASGTLPYDASTFGELVRLMFTRGPKRLASVAPSVPAPVAELVDRCLRVEPGERPADARQMLAELRKVREPEPPKLEEPKAEPRNVPKTQPIVWSGELSLSGSKGAGVLAATTPLPETPAKTPVPSTSSALDVASKSSAFDVVPSSQGAFEASNGASSDAGARSGTVALPVQDMTPQTFVLNMGSTSTPKQVWPEAGPIGRKQETSKGFERGVMIVVAAIGALCFGIWLVATLLGDDDEPAPPQRLTDVTAEPPRRLDEHTRAARAAMEAQDPLPGPAAPDDLRLRTPTDVARPPLHALQEPSGIWTAVLRQGHGTRRPTTASRVTVHYAGWRSADGQLFDSSYPRAEPSVFPVNGVIPGFAAALQLMVEGEKRRVWIPPHLAYENRPSGPQGMLVFDIELLRIEP
jgi:serine/threonine protein kinase